MKNVKDMTPYELRMNVMQTVAKSYKLGARTRNYQIAMKRIKHSVEGLVEVRDTIAINSMFQYDPIPIETEVVNNVHNLINEAMKNLQLAVRYLDQAANGTLLASNATRIRLSDDLNDFIIKFDEVEED